MRGRGRLWDHVGSRSIDARLRLAALTAAVETTRLRACSDRRPQGGLNCGRNTDLLGTSAPRLPSAPAQGLISMLDCGNIQTLFDAECDVS